MPVKFRIFLLPSYMNTQKNSVSNTPKVYIPDFPVSCRNFCPPTGDYRKISNSVEPLTSDYVKFSKLMKLSANFLPPIGKDGIFPGAVGALYRSYYVFGLVNFA